MITLYFGKIYKRPNSTKQSYEDERTVANVTLKDNVDVKSPVFLVNFDTSNYNYVKWPGDETHPDRFYYIDNTIYVHNSLYEVHCSLDIPATYKRIFQYELAGNVLYSNQDGYWDEYFDDHRFNPSHLDTYKVRGFGYEETYLHESANILGDDANDLWDTADGLYVMQAVSNGSIGGNGAGVHYWLFDTAGYNLVMKNLFSPWTGGLFDTVASRLACIKSLNWYPINYTNLITKLGSIASTADLEMAGDTIAVNAQYLTAYPAVLHFSSKIKIPRDDASQPYWMDNNRWNECQLYTPCGYTNLNLDFVYPRNHYWLACECAYDVCSGDMDIKFTYENKFSDSWNDETQTIAYAGSCNFGVDMMGLIQRNVDLKNTLWQATTVGASLAAGAFTAGATAPESAIAKFKESDNLQAAGYQNFAKMAKQNAMVDMASSGNLGGIGQVVAAGAVLSKLVPQPNRSCAGGQCGNSIAAMINTTQIGMIRLRLKPLRCRELADDLDTTPYEKYQAFCAKFGYPVNKYFSSLTAEPMGTYWVFDYIYFDLTNSYAKYDSQGITAEEMSAIENLCKSGFWLE